MCIIASIFSMTWSTLSSDVSIVYASDAGTKGACARELFHALFSSKYIIVFVFYATQE